jgi:hypothetical protein
MSSATPPLHRQGALWPWLVTPLVTLALFYVLHNERKVTAAVTDTPPPDEAAVPADTAPAP